MESTGKGLTLTVPSPGPDPHSGPIQVYMLAPSPASLYVGQTPKLTCKIINLPSDLGLKVTWSREKQGSVTPEPLELMEEFNGTYTATSSLVIITNDWESEEKFTCRVEHSDIPTALTKSISWKKGKQGFFLDQSHSRSRQIGSIQKTPTPSLPTCFPP